jgi:hypothetical protein
LPSRRGQAVLQLQHPIDIEPTASDGIYLNCAEVAVTASAASCTRALDCHDDQTSTSIELQIAQPNVLGERSPALLNPICRTSPTWLL